MNIVWFLSYFCTFLLGGIAVIVGFFTFIHFVDKKEEKTYEAAVAAQPTLQQKLKPYTYVSDESPLN